MNSAGRETGEPGQKMAAEYLKKSIKVLISLPLLEKMIITRKFPAVTSHVEQSRIQKMYWLSSREALCQMKYW